MRDLTNLISHKYAPSLRLRRRFKNPLLCRVHLHGLLQVLVLVRQYKRFRKEHEMLKAMNLSQLGDLLVHQVLSRNVKRVRKVVDLLVTL